MLRLIFFFFVRAALGFVLISAMTATVIHSGLIDPTHFDSFDDPFAYAFLKGPLIVWLACLALSLSPDLFDWPAPESRPGFVRFLRWSPLILPLLFGCLVIGCYRLGIGF